jgi:hypothetical protein
VDGQDRLVVGVQAVADLADRALGLAEEGRQVRAGAKGRALPGDHHHPGRVVVADAPGGGGDLGGHGLAHGVALVGLGPGEHPDAVVAGLDVGGGHGLLDGGGRWLLVGGRHRWLPGEHSRRSGYLGLGRGR